MNFIKNKKELRFTKARQDALALLESGITAVDPETLLRKSLLYGKRLNCLNIMNTEFNLISGRIFVVGGGKAAGRMAEALEKIVGPKNITAGIVNSLEKSRTVKKIKVIPAGHPLPDRAGAKGVLKMLEFKEKYTISEKDLIVCLLSGGASSLLPAPVKGISLKDKQKTTDLLIKSGADIREINSVRKHLSLIKGGQLAQFFAPARVASLIISDVIGNAPDVIASGPTAIDPTTFKDVYYTLEKYKLIQKLPASVRQRLFSGRDNRLPDTPKKLENATNFIIGSCRDALEEMALSAKNMGLKPLIMDMNLDGDVERDAVAKIKAAFSEEYGDHNVFLFGGETVLSLPSKTGQGGRNQHLAALIMNTCRDLAGNWAMAAISSDGRDYIKGTAGAIIDNNTINEITRTGADTDAYIKNFDSHRLFKKINSTLIKMDNTGTNVGDLMVVVKGH